MNYISLKHFVIAELITAFKALSLAFIAILLWWAL